MRLQKYVGNTLRKVKHDSEYVAPINHLSEWDSVNGKMFDGSVRDVTHSDAYIAEGLQEGMDCTRKMNDLIALDMIEVVWGIFVQNCENTKGKR